MKRIIFTGGGTAGHVTPNVALLEHFDRAEWEIHYIGSKSGMEEEIIKKVPQVEYHGIDTGKLRRYHSMKNFADAVHVIEGYAEARHLIHAIRPEVVFSKGGYVSVPVVAAAKGHCPIICHESDYTPGLANKLTARFADTVCVTFEDTLPCIKGGKGVWTGTPVRPELFRGNREEGLRFAGLAGEKPVLLVMGGSQGAQAVNEALRQALDKLLPSYDIIHLCGKGKKDDTCGRAGYAQFEYIDEQMKDLLAAADIVLSRSGANTVFELLALKKPALIVPLPLSASRGDQILNADYCVKKGYAEKLSQEAMTADTLSEALHSLYHQRDTYIRAMESCPGSKGTEKITEIIKAAVQK